MELAFELGHSYRLWNVLSEVMETDKPSGGDSEVMETAEADAEAAASKAKRFDVMVGKVSYVYCLYVRVCVCLCVCDWTRAHVRTNHSQCV